MAKTKPRKNTAKKSTGGPAKREILGPAVQQLLRAPSTGSRSPSVTPSIAPSTAEHSPAPNSMDVDLQPGKDEGDGQHALDSDDVRFPPPFSRIYSRFLEWCALCSDGHHLLASCSKCGAANCATCIPGLSKPGIKELESYTFHCLCCAKRKQVFYVRHSSTHRQARVLHFLQGLYDDAGKPAYPEGIEVAAHNIGASFRNRLRTPRLVIIEFVLHELSETATAGKMLHLSLSPNYINIKSDYLRYQQIPFDLKDNKAIRNHGSTMRRCLKEFEK